MTTDALTRSERGMIEFMERNAVKKKIIHELMGLGVDELSVYFDDLTQDNASYLFQSKQPSPWYKELINISSNFTPKELAEVYIKIMSNKATFGYGSFVFVTELRSVLKSKAKLSKEIKTKNIEKDEVVEVVEEKRVGKTGKNEVGLLTNMFEGHKIRMVENSISPLFVASDVAKALGYKRPNDAVNQHCKGDTVKHRITDSLGRSQEVRVIREPDVYRLVTNSKLPSAQKFEEWVMNDVLPSIRKHGGYLTPDKIEDVLTDPDLLIGLATALKEERQRVKEAELLIEEAKPKVEYHDEVLQSKYLITTTEISKDLGMSATDLNTLLNKKGLIYKQSNAWMPYSDFEWLVSEGFADYHVTKWGQHFKWTERGRKMIYKIVKENLTKRQIKALRNIEE